MQNLYAKEIKIKIQVTPEPAIEYQGELKAALWNDTLRNIPLTKNGETWLLPLPIEDGTLFVKVKVNLDKNPHQNYTMSNIILQQPFYEENATFNLVLTPVIGEHNSRAVYKLYEQDINRMPVDKLMEFYQKSRYAAVTRIKKMKNDWSKLHSYDVQAAYKFLESAVRLSKSIHLMPNKEVNDVNTWLRQAVSINPDRVINALGSLKNAEEITKIIENTVSIKLYDIWAKIVVIDDCNDSLPLLEKYRHAFTSFPEFKRKQLVEVTGTNLKTVDLSISECVASIARKAKPNNMFAKEITMKQISRLTELKALSAPNSKDAEDKDSRVESDLNYLQAISRKFKDTY